MRCAQKAGELFVCTTAANRARKGAPGVIRMRGVAGRTRALTHLVGKRETKENGVRARHRASAAGGRAGERTRTSEQVKGLAATRRRARARAQGSRDLEGTDAAASELPVPLRALAHAARGQARLRRGRRPAGRRPPPPRPALARPAVRTPNKLRVAQKRQESRPRSVGGAGRCRGSARAAGRDDCAAPRRRPRPRAQAASALRPSLSRGGEAARGSSQEVLRADRGRGR